MRSRANSEEDKQLKLDMIIEVTIKLYESQRKILTVTEIAKKAKIGKGTVYSYFKTKEEIYMEALVRNFARWHLGVRDFILDCQPSEHELIQYLCRSLADFTVFVDLVSISSTVLEENLNVAYLKTAKTSLQKETIRTSQLIASQFKRWSKDEVVVRIRRFYVYGIGFWKECFPSQQLQEALPENYGTKEEQTEKFFDEILAVNQLLWQLPPME